MKAKSELRSEVDELLAWIEAEQGLAARRVQALADLHEQGVALRDRLSGGIAPRDVVESAGAWMDECEMNS